MHEQAERERMWSRPHHGVQHYTGAHPTILTVCDYGTFSDARVYRMDYHPFTHDVARKEFSGPNHAAEARAWAERCLEVAP
jgi:hypothetical protein